MSAYSDYVTNSLASGLVLWLRHGESSGTTMTDSSGAGHNGTYAAAGITYGVTGAILPDSDTAVTYDATSATTFATVPDHADLDLGDGNFSIVVWIKRAGTGQHSIIAKGTNSYQLRFSSADVFQFIKQTSLAIATGGTITDTNWHMLAATRTTAGGTNKVYKDGVDVTTAGVSGTLSDTGNVLRLLHQGTSIDRFPGSIDETKIWKGRVLTDAEILQLWEHGQGIINVAIPAASISLTGLAPALDLAFAPPAASIAGASTIGTSQSEPVPAASGALTAVAPATTQSEAPPAATTTVIAGEPGQSIVVNIPAAALGGDAVAPTSTLLFGVPAAVVAGNATIGTEASEALPPASGAVAAAEPDADISVALPPGVVGTAAAAEALLDAEAAIPAAVINTDAGVADGVKGVILAIPAAVISTVALTPDFTTEHLVAIPAAAIATEAPAPVGHAQNAGDQGGGGGLGRPRFKPRKTKKELPSKNVTVQIPSALVVTAAKEPHWRKAQPDEDLAIILLYGS